MVLKQISAAVEDNVTMLVVLAGLLVILVAVIILVCTLWRQQRSVKSSQHLTFDEHILCNEGIPYFNQHAHIPITIPAFCNRESEEPGPIIPDYKTSSMGLIRESTLSDDDDFAAAAIDETTIAVSPQLSQLSQVSPQLSQRNSFWFSSSCDDSGRGSQQSYVISESTLSEIRKDSEADGKRKLARRRSL